MASKKPAKTAAASAAMSAPSTDLLKVVKARVAHMVQHYALNEGQAFLMWYAMEALEMDEAVAYEAVSFDGGNDKKIDLFFIDDEVEKVLIAQGKYSAKGAFRAKTGEFYELVHATDWLGDPEALKREGRPDLASAALEYLAAVEKGYSVEYAYIYMGPSRKEVLDAANQFNASESGGSPPKSARIVDLGLLQRMHEEYIDSGRRIPNASFLVTPLTTFEQSGAYGKALVTSLPGIVLRGLYKNHGDALFDRNVRLYLGVRKGSVNAGLRDTLAGAASRKQFWAFNNGLTFVCDRYEFNSANGEVTIHNFSIVNGCQTTVSIANASESAAGESEVLARIIACGNEGVVDDIITYTNRQTPIQPWDISSQDKVQKRLKKDFEAASPPYFYAMRRGETRPVSLADRKKFTEGGRLRVIHLDRLAQCLGAFGGIPMTAYKEKGRLFTIARDIVFPSDITATKALLAWTGGEVAEACVLDRIQQATGSGDTETVRILKRGGKLFVLSMMALVMTERNGATYLSRMKWAELVSNRGRERLAKYARVSLEWYLQAMKDILATGIELSPVLRSQDVWYPKLRDKVQSSWRVQSNSKKWVDDALPKL